MRGSSRWISAVPASSPESGMFCPPPRHSSPRCPVLLPPRPPLSLHPRHILSQECPMFRLVNAKNQQSNDRATKEFK